MSHDENGLVRDHVRKMLRRVRDQREGGGGPVAVSPEGSSTFMNIKQLMSVAALLTASTVGVSGDGITARSDVQSTLSQEEATETKGNGDAGKNAF